MEIYLEAYSQHNLQAQLKTHKPSKNVFRKILTMTEQFVLTLNKL